MASKNPTIKPKGINETDQRRKIALKDLPNPGYDYVFVDELYAEDYCGICLLVVRDPVRVSLCGHAFCRSCLDFWLRSCEESDDQTMRCPTDNNTISMDSIMPDQRFHRMISSLRVYCVNKDNGCSVTPELRDIEEHKCSCPMKTVTCDHCHAVNILRHEINTHYEACQDFPINCTFRQFGCATKLPRKVMKQHEIQSMQSHVTQMMVFVFKQQEETTTTITSLQRVLATKDQVREIKVNLNELHEKISNAEQRFGDLFKNMDERQRGIEKFGDFFKIMEEKRKGTEELHGMIVQKLDEVLNKMRETEIFSEDRGPFRKQDEFMKMVEENSKQTISKLDVLRKLMYENERKTLELQEEMYNNHKRTRSEHIKLCDNMAIYEAQFRQINSIRLIVDDNQNLIKVLQKEIIDLKQIQLDKK